MTVPSPPAAGPGKPGWEAKGKPADSRKEGSRGGAGRPKLSAVPGLQREGPGHSSHLALCGTGRATVHPQPSVPHPSFILHSCRVFARPLCICSSISAGPSARPPHLGAFTPHWPPSVHTVRPPWLQPCSPPPLHVIGTDPQVSLCTPPASTQTLGSVLQAQPLTAMGHAVPTSPG